MSQEITRPTHFFLRGGGWGGRGIKEVYQEICGFVQVVYDHSIRTSPKVNHTDGGEFMSSFIARMTSLCNTTESRAQPLCARVTSCLIAVRNP